jgi:hypothetical protein
VVKIFGLVRYLQEESFGKWYTRPKTHPSLYLKKKIPTVSDKQKKTITLTPRDLFQTLFVVSLRAKIDSVSSLKINEIVNITNAVFS